MRKNHYVILQTVALLGLLMFSQFIFSEDVPLRKLDDPGSDGGKGISHLRTRVYIPVTVSYEAGNLALFFESNVGMCNVSVMDENGNVQMTEIIDTNNATEFWFDVSALSPGLHSLRISYGSSLLMGEFYVE